MGVQLLQFLHPESEIGRVLIQSETHFVTLKFKLTYLIEAIQNYS